ncbi:PaaI family thioesterase [Conexibacter sp. DBS9H8]|uniref:PaaI family thioesterase n=1 Tax=Conexibacter sp. DBS9H8 TaxID=2937801 RepID=UPI0020100A45|nr:PaaI family thioesterase [Conexibacter sp. DBS9H8]
MTTGGLKERYNAELARGILEWGNSTEGLPGYLGIRFIDVSPGRLSAEADLRPELVTISGNVHGGALAAILDHITGAAVYPLMPTGSWAATTDLKINYIAAVKDGRVRAEASVLAMTTRSAVVRGEIYQAERLACAAQGTITIVAPRSD